MLVILASQWSCAGQPLYYLLGCEGAFRRLRLLEFRRTAHSGFGRVEKTSASVSLVFGVRACVGG
jgi:hypothetical protein